MSHKPLTELERAGMEHHKLLPDSPSQFNNGFRLGVNWAEQNAVNVTTVVSFGAWLVDNHESVFSGGEDQIMKLGSDFLTQHTDKPAKDNNGQNEIQEHVSQFMKEWLFDQDSSTREAWGEVGYAVMDALSEVS